MAKGHPIILVVGARPNFMKIAPLYSALKKRRVEQILVHTGQHYDDKMSKVFFDDLGLPEPDVYLGVGSGSHSQQTAKVMVEFEKVCIENRPKLVVVVGDVNSTLGCTLVASKMGVKTAHIEAGLRSGDMVMPEEINRVVTDAIADVLLTPSADANENLLREGRESRDIYMVGNIMIDSLLSNLEKYQSIKIREKLGIKGKKYATLTLHRPSNVDDVEILRGIISAIIEISEDIDVVFPIHPRTRINLENTGLMETLYSIESIVLTEPLGYLDFMSLISDSSVVLTDSGGLQEETTYLGIPCLTVRESTERPITVSEGTNKIIGCNKNDILREFRILDLDKERTLAKIKYWDGGTAERIADIIMEQ